DMPPSIQAKLLRALQERQFYPVGSEKPVFVDVRIIVATNKQLEDEVAKGAFRQDLFYRLHVIPIHLPPLRERKEDIPHLADQIGRPRFRRNSCARYKSVSSIPLEAKSQFSWIFESSSPRISNWRTRWQRAHFVRIYFIGFTSFQSICLLSERGKKISHTWPIVFSKSFRNR